MPGELPFWLRFVSLCQVLFELSVFLLGHTLCTSAISAIFSVPWDNESGFLPHLSSSSQRACCSGSSSTMTWAWKGRQEQARVTEKVSSYLCHHSREGSCYPAMEWQWKDRLWMEGKKEGSGKCKGRQSCSNLWSEERQGKVGDMEWVWKSCWFPAYRKLSLQE